MSISWPIYSIQEAFGNIESTWDKNDKVFLVRIPEQIEINEVKVEGFNVIVERTLNG